MAASSASGHGYHQLHYSVAHPQPHHFFTRPRRDTPFPQRGKPPAPQSSSSPSPSPSSSSWGCSSPHKTTARLSSTAPATNGWTSTATTATTSQPYWAVKIEKEAEADRVEDGEDGEEEEEGDDKFSGEEEEEDRYNGGGGSDVEEEDERGEEGEVIDLAYDIEDDKMVWSHQSRSDSDEEEDVEEFEDDAEDHDKREGCGPGKTPNLCSGHDDHVVGAASDSPWLERGSESGSSEVRAATSTRSAQDKDWDEGGGYDVGADDQEVNDGDSSDEEEEEECTTTDHYSQSQPPPSSAPAVDVPAPAAPATAQEGDLSGGYPIDYLGLAGEGDQDALAFDCDFLLELLRAEELNNGECDMGVAAAAQQQQHLHQQRHSHLQQQHQQHPDPPQRQTHHHHHGSSTWSRPDQGQGRGEADGSTLKQLLESYRGQQPYAQAHTQAQALHDDQSPQAQVEGASCASAVAGGMVSTTKTLAQLFGLPQPLYLSASNPSTTLSALEALNQHRRRSKTREAAVVLPPSLTPFLSQMTAYLTPSIADPQEDGSTATGGSPTTKRKSTVTYAPLPLLHAEAKRARAEASDHLAAHQRNLMYGGHQLQEDVASHMEGETGGGHIDSLLTYLDSPMSISFDASSTPCSTPSSPFSPTHQPQHHHHLHDSLLRGPATADPHRVAGQPHNRPLVEYAREALRTCGTASTLTSTMTTASPAQAQPTTDADADIDSDFLEEVMQFATQLEQDLLS